METYVRRLQEKVKLIKQQLNMNIQTNSLNGYEETEEAFEEILNNQKNIPEED